MGSVKQMPQPAAQAIPARASGSPTRPHDFDGLACQGDWVMAERVASVKHTLGGLHVPEESQMPVWQVLSVGERVTRIKVGERILFANPTATIAHDGRGFALLRADQIVCTLPMPDPDAAPRIMLAGSLQ